MPTYGFSLNAEAATHNSLTISVTTASTGTSGETFTVAAEVSGTVVSSATVTTGAEGESVNATIMGLSPSTTYTITGKINESPAATSITASTTAPSSDPKTATESQWQDLANRVKAKADASSVPTVNDTLTSTSTSDALSANQGKVLKDLIDSIAIRGAGAPTTSTVGQVGTLYEDTTNGNLYICTDATNPYAWEEVGAGPTVVQTLGTSTADVMSQNAISSLIFGNISRQDRIHLGNTSAGGDYSVSIGKGALVSGGYTTAVGASASIFNSEATALGAQSYAGADSSVALGFGAKATKKGEVNIGTSNASSPQNYGYNSSAYRLLTGLYDPQSAHDAATKGYVDTAVAGKQDTLTAGDGISITNGVISCTFANGNGVSY